MRRRGLALLFHRPINRHSTAFSSTTPIDALVTLNNGDPHNSSYQEQHYKVPGRQEETHLARVGMDGNVLDPAVVTILDIAACLKEVIEPLDGVLCGSRAFE